MFLGRSRVDDLIYAKFDFVIDLNGFYVKSSKIK